MGEGVKEFRYGLGEKEGKEVGEGKKYSGKSLYEERVGKEVKGRLVMVMKDGGGG